MRFGTYSQRTVALERWYHTLFGFTQGWGTATIVMGLILPAELWQRLVPAGAAALSLYAWRLVARRWKRAFQADIDSWSI